MSWTEERITALRQLWSDGLSAAEIGRRLDVSKNAVIGKAHRLGLPSRPSPIKRGKASAKKLTKTTSPTIARNKAQGPTCCWPFGDPGDPEFHFCGKPALPAKPYCSEHYAMAYIQVRARNGESS